MNILCDESFLKEQLMDKLTRHIKNGISQKKQSLAYIGRTNQDYVRAVIRALLATFTTTYCTRCM